MSDDLKALRLVNKEIRKLEKELKLYQEWKDLMLEMMFTHEHNQELLKRIEK